jgi:elongation factor P
MIPATEIKEGMTLELEGKLCKVLEVSRHAGAGQMQGFMAVKLHDIRFGHFFERHIKQNDKIKEIAVVRRQMDFLYPDAEGYVFMDPDSYEQVMIPKAMVGKSHKLFKDGMKVTIEMLDDEAISVEFPKNMEFKVISTGSGAHATQENTMKSAILENNIEILVPHFVETGETVRIDTDKLKYIERVAIKRI